MFRCFSFLTPAGFEPDHTTRNFALCPIIFCACAWKGDAGFRRARVARYMCISTISLPAFSCSEDCTIDHSSVCSSARGSRSEVFFSATKHASEAVLRIPFTDLGLPYFHRSHSTSARNTTPRSSNPAGFGRAWSSASNRTRLFWCILFTQATVHDIDTTERSVLLML